MNESLLQPYRTVVTSFNPKTTVASESRSPSDYFEEGDWVLCVAGCHNWVSCAVSNGEVQVYDQDRMHCLQTYKMGSSSRESQVTDIQGDACSSHPFTLATTSSNGCLTLFDIRQQSVPVCQIHLPRSEEQALSVSLGFDGTLAAVGSSRAKIHFFDIRSTRSLLGTYNQVHTGEITKVRFQTLTSFGTTSTTTPILVSAAEDGLACVFDTSQPSEEAAVKNVLAVQSPIRQVGFFGPNSDAIYCLTGSESLKLWRIDDSICRKDYGDDLRQRLSQLNENEGSEIEYLVDCSWDSSRQELLLLAGNTNGMASLFKVQEENISILHRLGGGHRGVVRAWGLLSTNVFVTVGEDARMCEWNRMCKQLHVAHSVSHKSASAIPVRKLTSHPGQKAGGGPLRRQRGRMTASPY